MRFFLHLARMPPSTPTSRTTVSFSSTQPAREPEARVIPLWEMRWVEAGKNSTSSIAALRSLRVAFSGRATWKVSSSDLTKMNILDEPFLLLQRELNGALGRKEKDEGMVRRLAYLLEVQVLLRRSYSA